MQNYCEPSQNYIIQAFGSLTGPKCLTKPDFENNASYRFHLYVWFKTWFRLLLQLYMWLHLQLASALQLGLWMLTVGSDVHRYLLRSHTLRPPRMQPGN